MSICSDSPNDAEPSLPLGGIDLASQPIRIARAPAVTRRDVYAVLSLLTLVPVALCIGHRHWGAICRVLTRVMFAGRSSRKRTQAGLRIAFGAEELTGHGLLQTVCRDLDAHRQELRLQIIRDLLFRDWRPEIRVDGGSHLDEALAAGRGAILWVSRFAFADTVAKIGLWREGYPPVHLSRSVHGFSNSRFGRRWLNPLQQRMENRYLAERVVMREGAPSAAMRRLHNVLVENGIVSITVDSWGAHAAEVPFLGGRLRIATGALSLGWKTGARLMPVFVIREPQTGIFRLLIDEPLRIDRAKSKGDAQMRGVAQYVSRLERHVAAYPGQWRDWPNLRPIGAQFSASRSTVSIPCPGGPWPNVVACSACLEAWCAAIA
jgi:lauroyl/myristoyl acyltransferase